MSNRFYDEYEPVGGVLSQPEPDFVLEGVQPIRTGDRISGFIKRTNCEEIADLHGRKVICYDPEQQRGWRITYRDGAEERRQYLIKPSKVKQIAHAIAENREYNRVRTVNARHGHVALHFEPYDTETLEIGRLFIFRLETADGVDGLLTIPDSAHRQEGDCFFARRIATGRTQVFSSEHAGFRPDTYELVLLVTLTDKRGEGESHYEHNELITKSAATRRAFLEGGEVSHANWTVHELMRLNSTTRELLEVYEKSISANSPKIVTFSTLAKGIEEGWHAYLSTETRPAVAAQLDTILRMAREEVPEWGLLPFGRRRLERERSLYSQAIVQRAMLRIYGEWYATNERDGTPGDWERWRPFLRRLKTQHSYRSFQGEFLSRENPLFYEEGGGIYQLNKSARLRKERCLRTETSFELNPLQDLTVQNTRLSLDFMFEQLRNYLAYQVFVVGEGIV